MTNVVAAFQSPALFNILARSSCWTMRMAPLGDHEGLTELSELSVPTWDADRDAAPDVVIVCSPAQLGAASLRWPSAKVLWAVHNGYERGLLPPEHEAEVNGVICFSEKVRWLQQARKKVKHYFVSPAYEPDPVWDGRILDGLFTLRNRPLGRSDDADSVIAAITEGLPHTIYGQDQPAGIADGERKRELRRTSAAYVSPMQRTAGFGLAEHEALASGVPLIGGWWGDLEEEMSDDYWGLSHNLYKMSLATERVLNDEDGARELSQLGLDYIRRYRSAERMDDSVRDMLAAIG